MTTLDYDLLGEASRLVSGEQIRRPTPVRDRWGRWHRDPAGEYDWFYGLPESERVYIARYYMSPNGVPVDVLADMAYLDIDAWAGRFVAAVRASRDRKALDLDVLDDAWAGCSTELDSDDALLGPEEVADLLAVKRNTLVQWRKRGQLPAPALTLSGLPIWRRGDVLAFAALTDRLVLAASE